MTATEIAALGTLGTAALGGLIKLGTWLFAESAKRNVNRRTDLMNIITRQDEEIRCLKQEANDHKDSCEGRIAGLERRVQDAERDRSQMEGVLYRMGWEKGPRGWRRNGEGEAK